MQGANLIDGKRWWPIIDGFFASKWIKTNLQASPGIDIKPMERKMFLRSQDKEFTGLTTLLAIAQRCFAIIKKNITGTDSHVLASPELSWSCRDRNSQLEESHCLYSVSRLISCPSPADRLAIFNLDSALCAFVCKIHRLAPFGLSNLDAQTLTTLDWVVGRRVGPHENATTFVLSEPIPILRIARQMPSLLLSMLLASTRPAPKGCLVHQAQSSTVDHPKINKQSDTARSIRVALRIKLHHEGVSVLSKII